MFIRILFQDKLQSQQNLEEKQQKKLKEREDEITKQLSLIRSIKETEADLKEALTVSSYHSNHLVTIVTI